MLSLYLFLYIFTVYCTCNIVFYIAKLFNILFKKLLFCLFCMSFEERDGDNIAFQKLPIFSLYFSYF
jgi:hypothetical protein